jgi:bifunctional DNA-binding transcriptional regulator/antitoxin component of YhaV-PrlF toxin-antitoxin module
MYTAKGQLLIPKPIRDALYAGKGTVFSMRLDRGRVILETVSRKNGKQLSDWLPKWQVRRRLDHEELIADVL